MRRAALLLLAVALGCRAPASHEKGSLLGARVSEEALAQVYEPRRLALVVGISEFEDPSWRRLRYAAKDASDLAAALGDPKRGRFERVTVLTGATRTTRRALLAALSELHAQANRPDDVVVVYLSGHGTLARDEKGELRRYLVTSDAQQARVHGTALAIDELKARLDGFTSRRRLMVLATCHSGSGKSLLPPGLAEELQGIKSSFFARPLEQSSRASLVFSACDWGETAREDDELKNDIYTHFLVEGLAGAADRNEDGAVSATEAHDFARRRTWAFTQGRQRPSAEILEVGADPVLLSGRVARGGQPELYSYQPRLDGFTLKVDGQERVELPGGAAVRPGRRKVELTKGGVQLFADEVEVGVGERLELDGLLARKAPRFAVSLVSGAFGFLDEKSREQVLPPAAVLGLSLRVDEAPWPGFALAVDLKATRGEHALRLEPGGEVPVSVTAVAVGAAVPYVVRFSHGGLLAGPRVAGLWLERSFSLETYRAGQRYATVSPGVLLGAYLRPLERLELSAQAELMMTYVVVDGQGQALGFAGGWAGAGWRF